MAEPQPPGLTPGQTIELQDGRHAIVRFVGDTQFAPGSWVGVELDSPTGKNDGTVKGDRYFDCAPGHGMFVRPAAVVAVVPSSRPESVPKASGGSMAKPSSRPSSMAPPKRPTIVAPPPKRQSISTQGSGSGSRLLRSPTKSPTKRLSSTTSSGTSGSGTSSTSNPKRPAPNNGNGHLSRPLVSSAAGVRTSGSARPSLAGPTRAPRSNLAPSSSTNASHRQQLIGRPRRELNMQSLDSIRGLSQTWREGDMETEGQTTRPSVPSPPLSGLQGEPLQQEITSPLLSAGSGRSGTLGSEALSPTMEPLSPRMGQRTTTAPSVTSNRDVEDLKTKLRLMEKKRLEDRERLKTLEKVQAERDRFEGIIQKLQAKYQPQQQEMAELRKQLKVAEGKMKEVEEQQAEHEVTMEMATLDREMAEETAEVLKTELEALKSKTEELELEVEVLREENQLLNEEVPAEERASQGWLQMEKSNERLREALVRLRDMTQQQEEELKEQVKSLEEDVQELSGVKGQLESAEGKLKAAERNIEELRQQLETALGAEEMIEELTERNMNMSEEISELRAVIEDLESLKELSDELELNHVETEKQMQEEMDYRDGLMAEQLRRAAQQKESIENYEYTLARFRDLVASLQSDLDDIRASQQTTEAEAAELNSHSRAMMDLNMKLQAAASRTQVKTIDLELRRLDAQEAVEHLAVVQLFLPEAFRSERDSILAWLRFKRVAFKARLVHGLVKERIGGHSLNRQENNMFAALDVLNRLMWLSAMSDRFVAAMASCSVEQFIQLGDALNELEPVERALNGWIDGLRRDDVDEKQAASQLKRLMALMLHLAEVHLPDETEDFANDVQMRCVLIQSSLENTSSAMSMIKDVASNGVSATGSDEDDNGRDVLRQMDDVIVATRSAKVIINKTARSLDELKMRSLSLLPETLPAFERCENMSNELREFCQALGECILDWSRQEEDGSSSRSYEQVEQLLHRTTLEHFHTNDITPFSTFREKLRILHSSLNDIHTLANDLSQTIEFESLPSPWILCAQDMRASARDPEAVEAQLKSLRDAAHSSATQLSMRDKLLEESSVKIELLEARAENASKKSEHIIELEQSLSNLRRREKTLEAMLDARSRELQELESEREQWKASTNAKKARGRGTTTSEGEEGEEEQGPEGTTGWAQDARNARASIRAIQICQQEIHDLQSSVRYLRQENQRLRDHDLKNRANWLHEPLIPEPNPIETQRNLLKKEARDVMLEMLSFVTTTTTTMKEGSGKYAAEVFDLRKMIPKDRLKWRPARETPQWHILRQQEEWERWREWKEEVLEKGKMMGIGSGSGSGSAAMVTEGNPKRKNKRRTRARPTGVQQLSATTGLEMMMDQMDKLELSTAAAAAVASGHEKLVDPKSEVEIADGEERGSSPGVEP
ncbi:MAG: Fructose-2,6-bisphosphatase [Watsoniomyces obsoletus]|nr:MAG: Fructose-2,6-bisphosphatase [Watsoniomyces obsoletus]